MTGFAPDVIRSGRVIIRQTDNGEYKPMPVSGSAYAALPEGQEYMIASVLTRNPQASILVRGTVNPNVSPYQVAPIQSAFQEATGNKILFRAD